MILFAHSEWCIYPSHKTLDNFVSTKKIITQYPSYSVHHTLNTLDVSSGALTVSSIIHMTGVVTYLGRGNSILSELIVKIPEIVIRQHPV